MKAEQSAEVDGRTIGTNAAEHTADHPYSVSRLRRAVIRFFGGQALQAVGYGAILLLLVRLLPIADYGAYMLLAGLAEMTLIVASFGILSTAKRYLPQAVLSVSASRLFGFVFAVTALQAAVLGLVAVLLWIYWVPVTAVMGLSPMQADAARPAILLFFLVPAVRFICELLDALLEQGRSRFVSACMVNARLAGIMILVAAGWKIGLPAVVILDVGVTAACLLLAYGFLIRSLAVLHAPAADGPLPTRDIARFLWHMAAADLLGSALSAGAMRFALANSIGVVESGLFAFLQSLQRLAGRYLLPGTLLRGLVMPVLVSRAAGPGGLSVIAQGASLLIKSNLLVVGGGIAVVAVAGDRIVDMLSGGKFEHAGMTLLLMFCALIPAAQALVLGMVLQVLGKTSVLRSSSILAPVALFLVWLCAGYGLDVAIVILIVSGGLSNLIVTRALVRATGIGIDWWGQGRIWAAAAGGIALGWALRAAGLPVIPAGGLALAGFLALLVVWKPFNRSDQAIVERVTGLRLARRLAYLLTAR